MPLPLANVIQDAFSPLISLFEAILVFLHSHVLGGSWGLSIIGLTVVVRAVLVPLTFSQFRSMQNMQRVAPKIKELQAKYKEDKQRLNEEMMKLYREEGVNPFASCLPLLLQFPVLISLFYMLRTNLKLDICGPELRQHFSQVLGHTITHNSQIPNSQLAKISCDSVAPHSARFLFIPDITHKTTGLVLVVLLVLYIGSQLASSVIMSAAADPNQRRMMIALPFLFTAFIFTFPGGLLVYWITTNLWTIGQQYWVRRRVGPPVPPPPKGGGDGAGGGGRRGSGGSGGSGGDDNGGAPSGREPALAGAAAGGGPAAAPPRPPRKKKKRSGRRR